MTFLQVEVNATYTQIRRAIDRAEEAGQDAFVERGLMRLHDEEAERALAEFETALRSSDDLRARVGAVIAGLLSLRWDACERWCDDSVRGEFSALGKLAEAAVWLGRPSTDGPAPDSDAIRALGEELEDELEFEGLQDSLHLVCGWLDLISGDAERARKRFSAIEGTTREHSLCIYLTAWAHALDRDREGATRRYESLAQDQRWLLAVLVLDVNPNFAKERRVLEAIDSVPAAHAAVLAARRSLALQETPGPADWEAGPVVTAAELETARCQLAVVAAGRDLERLAALLETGLVRRLPSAETLFWKGVRDHLSGRAGVPRALIESDKRGHPRAALIVARIWIREGKREEARRAVLHVAESGDDRIRLLRAQLDADRPTEQRKRLQQLDAGGSRRGAYDQALVDIRDSARVFGPDRAARRRSMLTQASVMLRTALDSGERLPVDSDLIASCAAFAAKPSRGATECAAMWPRLAEIPAHERSGWASWIVALARLSSGADDVCHEDCERLITHLEAVPNVRAEACLGLAGALTRASLETDCPERAKQLEQSLARLSSVADLPDVDRLRVRVQIARARLDGASALMDRLRKDFAKSLGVALLTAREAIRRGDSAAARAAFDTVVPVDDLEKWLATTLAGFVLGETVEAAEVPSAWIDQDPKMVAAYDLVRAGLLFAREEVELGFEALRKAAHQFDVSPVFDMTAYVGWFCSQAPVGQIPEVVRDAVRDMVGNSVDGQDPLTLARCALAIEDVELAKRYWELAIEAGGETESRARTEFASYLCYEAIGQLGAEEARVAVASLRTAAELLRGRPDADPPDSSAEGRTRSRAAAPRGLDPDVVSRFASYHEERLALGNLVAAVIERVPTGFQNLGRLNVLVEHLKADELLWEAIIEGNGRQSRERWREFLLGNGELDILHALANLYHDTFMNSDAEVDPSHPATSAALWGALLSSRDFWDRFAQRRYTDPTRSEKRDLDEGERDDLLQRVLEQTVHEYRIRAARALFSGDQRTARTYAECLGVLRRGKASIEDQLSESSVLVAWNWDGDFGGRVVDACESAIEGWVRDLEGATKKELERTEERPSNLDQNYPAACKLWEAFLMLGVRTELALRNYLDVMNSWSNRLIRVGEIERMSKMIVPARRWAEELATLATLGENSNPSNQTLSEYFVCRGFGKHKNGDPSGAIPDYDEAIRWNPAHREASKLREQARDALHRNDLERVRKLADSGSIESAQSLLDEVREKLVDKRITRFFQVLIWFRSAERFFNRGDLRRAIDYCEKAYELGPEQTDIGQFLDDLRRARGF